MIAREHGASVVETVTGDGVQLLAKLLLLGSGFGGCFGGSDN